MVGGSATSGRSLTAAQVSEAVERVAASFVEQEPKPAPIRRTKSGLSQSLTNVEEEWFSETREHSFQVDGVEVSVVEYCPRVFHFIRQVEAVDDNFFAEEWRLQKNKVEMNLGEGRSQALFLKSKNFEFMCKTIAEGEADVLCKVLKTYTSHIVDHPNSLLSRFYLLIKVQVAKDFGYLLCFGDVFGNASYLNEKWDIKGRIPKPGKYLSYPHLIRHAYEPDPHLIETPRERQRRANDAPAQEDEIEVAPEDKMTIWTRKDKDLTRLFWVENPTRDKLVNQILLDYGWLETAGLMDYSLLIGVAYKEGKQSRKGKHYIIKNMRVDPLEDGEEAPAERRPSAQHPRPSGFEPLSEFADGISSLNDQEVYYIGIIDMLTEYGAAKKFANFFKGFLWTDETLSTIPPPAYKKRIATFTELIFPSIVP
ncbi:phosphatidylinositol-4-phosphate 5-kinase [Angomonas deanei]|nr:phosphatidylinositol-4-phosphate 5-kinase [Angomonas deanei]|eukprot:EPY27185.1 phosphatidylinositol-4-phosphate 5-kinase [Angomonas deanei]